MKNDSQISCFVTAEEYKIVKGEAQKNFRSISNYIRFLVLKNLKEKENGK